MRRFIKLLLIPMFLMAVSCCECGKEYITKIQEKCIDKGKYEYLGKREVFVHGPIDENGYEDFIRLKEFHFRIDGHDYYSILPAGMGFTGDIVHIEEACEKCKNMKDKRLDAERELTNLLNNINERLKNGVTKSELESALKKQEKNIVKQFDDIIDSWD